MPTRRIATGIIALLLSPGAGWAAGAAEPASLVHTVYGYIGVVLFVAAYFLVPLENKIHLRKSKPVMLAAGAIWVLLAVALIRTGDTHSAEQAIRESLLEYAELFLFLLAAMTYINAMEERNVFQCLRAFLVSREMSLRQVFWVTGLLAFCISPVADNLTTALLMGAVVMAVGGQNTRFVSLACINVVVAANAGGAFSPFGDITTLMVWQKGKVDFLEFFQLLVPSAVNWLLPAACMSLGVDRFVPERSDDVVQLKYGAGAIIGLFVLTMATAVSFHTFLHLPPAAGMMFGLGYLGLFSYHIKIHEGRHERYDFILGAQSRETADPLIGITQSNRRLDAIIDTIADPVFAIDRHHVITHWNQGMERLSCIPAAQAVGTRRQWEPFYTQERPVLADLVVDLANEQLVDRHYSGMARRNPNVESAFDAIDFFPGIGPDGKWLSFSAGQLLDKDGLMIGAVEVLREETLAKRPAKHFDIMQRVAQAEWDTLMFFYGVILCVGGLARFGYLRAISNILYNDLGPTAANTLVGIVSAVLDNIPVMFAVLTMDPDMSHGQWMLVTLTAGVGGSMLSVGSAAGVALMGTARGKYTFGAHLKQTPVIALGYAAAILCHMFLNADLF